MQAGDVYRKRKQHCLVLGLQNGVVRAQNFHITEDQRVVRDEPKFFGLEDNLGVLIGSVTDPHNDRFLVRLLEAVAGRDKLFGLENAE